MRSTIEWAVPLFLGLCFTPLGGLKLYGFRKGYEGGPDRTLWERLRAGSCAPEHCGLPSRLRRPLLLAMDLLFLAIGLYGVIVFVTVMLT